VQLYSGAVVTTGANGSYQFTNQLLGYYNLTVRDASLRPRRGHQLQLQVSGATVTQNFTMAGVATVSGLVTNTDGTPAENYSLTLFSQNSTIGGTQYVTTGGDGTYRVAEVPIGGFTVTVTQLALHSGRLHQRRGHGQRRQRNSQHQIISSTVTLPLTAHRRR